MQKLLFLLFLAFSVNTFGALSSEIGVSISIDKTNTLLKELSGDFTVEDEEIEFGGGGFFDEIQKRRVSLSLDSLINFELDGFDRASAEINFKKLTLLLEGFYYENITVVKRSGVRARVKTIIKCESLPIILENWKGHMSTSIAFDGKTLNLNKDKGVFDLDGGDISIDFSSCTGPKGVDLIFKDEIKEWINSAEGKELLFEQAISYGQEFLNENWERIKENDLKFDLLGTEVSLIVEDIEFFENYLQVKGSVKAENNKKDYKLLLEKGAFESFTDEAGILLPKEFFSKLVPDIIKESSLSFQMYRADIPGVDFLFNSRFIQFFVWSDLLNFRKDSNFKTDIAITDTKVHLVKTRGSGFSYNLNGRHDIEMSFLNSRGTEYPYMNFYGGLKGSIDLDLNNEGFSFVVKNPDVSAKRSWSPLMTKWRKSKPMGKPWMSMIMPRVENAFKGMEFNYTWKDLGISDYIQAVSMKETQKAFFLNVELKEKEETRSLASVKAVK
ncbi:MAG: hypothetical protein ACRBBP_04640 [Bdellovibrionales bacterium]